MNLYKLPHTIDTKALLENLNIDKGGIRILADKMESHLIYIHALNVVGANILKQDALSIGADLATPRDTITHGKEFVDVVLIATTKQLKTLCKKELSQPFGLKAVALELKSLLPKREFPTQIMGVINANSDSFFQGSRFQDDEAVAKIAQMIDEGADIIDIGGVSSRPFSDEVSSDEELQRVKPIIDAIYEKKLCDKALFSLDTYRPQVADYALSKGFHIINDITGLRDDHLAKIIASYDATVVIMHMQGSPKTMQNDPQYDDVIAEVDAFFTEQITKALSFGIADIILDVGIGFGKRLEHNLKLITHLRHFKRFDYPLLIGASRKSMIDHITPTPIEDRLIPTVAIHQEALNNGANIIRCHDVREHIQMMKIWHAFKDN